MKTDNASGIAASLQKAISRKTFKMKLLTKDKHSFIEGTPSFSNIRKKYLATQCGAKIKKARRNSKIFKRIYISICTNTN